MIRGIRIDYHAREDRFVGLKIHQGHLLVHIHGCFEDIAVLHRFNYVTLDGIRVRVSYLKIFNWLHPFN